MNDPRLAAALMAYAAGIPSSVHLMNTNVVDAAPTAALQSSTHSFVDPSFVGSNLQPSSLAFGATEHASMPFDASAVSRETILGLGSNASVLGLSSQPSQDANDGMARPADVALANAKRKRASAFEFDQIRSTRSSSVPPDAHQLRQTHQDQLLALGSGLSGNESQSRSASSTPSVDISQIRSKADRKVARRLKHREVETNRRQRMRAHFEELKQLISTADPLLLSSRYSAVELAREHALHQDDVLVAAIRLIQRYRQELGVVTASKHSVTGVSTVSYRPAY